MRLKEEDIDVSICGSICADYLCRSGVQGSRQLDTENAMKNRLADIAVASVILAFGAYVAYWYLCGGWCATDS